MAAEIGPGGSVGCGDLRQERMMRLFNDGRPGPVLAAGCLAVMFAAFGVGSASAAISAPPVAGHNITVFPDRDFVHVDGYAAGQSLTVNVVRNGTVIGTATGA